MHFNFELILFYAVLVCGGLYLLDIIFFAPRRQRKAHAQGKTPHMPIIMDYARSFFPVLLIVFLLRAFLFEPFRIPSGSLEPTLLQGDFILVNKYQYGTRLPITQTKLFGDGKPQRGDIMVFRWPANKSYDFVKRVIGLPGDHISYVNKELYINGQKIPQVELGKAIAYDEQGMKRTMLKKQENLLNVQHEMFVDPERTSRDYRDLVVPAGMYFVLGDNRDDSADSRYWGFVPEENIVGKAILIWMSWDGIHTTVRWNRIGKSVYE
ncbi:MAG TPA: signal peptidase I [Gammaproteobacteria bacterium]|jgi:signal peptidase I|nr:signal peptidase I [Gammaproteobacteria bacterium]